MSLELYTPEISALALGNPYPDRLPEPAVSSEKRSPICGSRVTVDVVLDADGRVAEVGTLVRACLLGQASSTLLAQHVIGRTPADLADARDGLANWLAGSGPMPNWPGLHVFTPGLKLTARHASIRLAFEAAADAAAMAAAADDAARVGAKGAGRGGESAGPSPLGDDA